MVETMSAIHPAPLSQHGVSMNRKHSKKSRVPQAAMGDAPITELSLSPTLGHQLSFIKMGQQPKSDDEQPSSDNATNKPSKPSSHRTCNPLPAWLADTFRSLAKKHPLRLLLPPADQLTTNNHNHLAPQHEDPVQDTLFFNLHVPAPTSINKETDFQDSPDPNSSLLTRSFEDDENTAYTNVIPRSRISESLPFSTPGPGLGSSTIVVSPKTASSPTLWADFHSESDLRLAVPHTTSNSSDSGDFRDECALNDCEWNALPPDLAVASPFSEIYATPGPTYYASRVLHLSSPPEEPLGCDSDSEQNKSGTQSADSINFQWKPFHRKDITPQNQSKPVAFAYGPGETFDSILSDSLVLEESTIETGPEQSRSALRNAPVPPVSPNPFRFFLPPETREGFPSPLVPDFQELSQKQTVNQKRPSQPVPDVATPRLVIPQTVIPTPRANLTGIGTNRTFPEINAINLTTLGNTPGFMSSGGNGHNSICSEESMDSVELWGCRTKQYD